MENEQLCINLVKSESEEEVEYQLKAADYWDDESMWRYYGDNENNFATIGNQQSRPEAAIVEKIINSVDAVLMSECLKKGIDPESDNAPASVIAAQEEYFQIDNGRLSNLTASERTSLANNISFVATGAKDNPCYIIIDKGEGQTPLKMADTLLSIGKSNKLRIPFVQGKFNMGGTGVFQFCGKGNFQLIISKRNPDIAAHEKNDPSSSSWGFTLVRREDPTQGVRSSSFKYLAPRGNILTLHNDFLSILPGEYPAAYSGQMEWGTYIKLYEYQMTGLKTNILFDLYNRLSLLMPSIALPIRFYERRSGYSGHTLETTLSGLSVRLDEDKRKNLEVGFPTSSAIAVNGQAMKVSIFAFKRGQAEKYSDKEGILFSINGQTHGHITQSFFSRQAVRMGYLADSLLILVDCSELDGRSIEDLFMNSRDRLRGGELKSAIESTLEELIRTHAGLKELRERRRREDVESKLEDSKPLAEVLKTIIKKSPSLSKLFIKGVRLPDPFNTKNAGENLTYSGKKFPTFFKLIKSFPKTNPKKCALNTGFRIQYKTDAENDYFDRDSDSGSIIMKSNDVEIKNFSINLWNGIATVSIKLSSNEKEGDKLHFESEINDISRVKPFRDEFFLLVIAAMAKIPGIPGSRKPPSSNKDGKTTTSSSFLDLPNLIEVHRDEWDTHKFTKESVLKVVDSGDVGYDFFINIDNIHLLTEKKAITSITPKILEARYKYGMVLIGIALLNDNLIAAAEGSEENTETPNVYESIEYVTRVISPILLPMISSLGELQVENLESTFV